MTTGQQPPVSPGTSSRIKERQDQPEHLNRLLAYSHLYRVAMWWRRIRIWGNVLLALTAPLFAIFFLASSGTRGAIAAAWLVLGRTVLSGLEQSATLRAVNIQELYDTKLFHLPWNQALVGRQPVPDDVSSAARRIPDHTPYLDWYSVGLGNTPWPGDVLLCQRQSAVWSRRDHHAYGTFLTIVGGAWTLAIIVFALVRDMTLLDFLVALFLPSAAALLDTIELARSHWQQSAKRRQVEDDIHDVWNTYQANPRDIPVEECRRLQDATYLLRRDGPAVPNWFYKLRRPETTAVTNDGTTTLRSSSDSG
ncbi:S-4TM family putative pore-forming effector [Streptomyces sp. SM1]|uniref:S-4TM family putative pore-forming effector n=1 Tax=Streptomyces sp. SM1 TaxID=402229 RepID=UPI000CD5A6BA|nr:S-4TM family putative pore-forming effector [Streptomyces sp. SM1]